jgi:hypothetical protein
MVLVSGLLLFAAPQLAAAQSAADKAAGDALFHEGKKLIASGDDIAACAKFEASLARLVQLGTQIALASCYEQIGKTASAWGAFRAAASAASKAHDKRQQFAEQHASALEARLSKLVIRLESAHRVDGLEILRDRSALAPAELATPIPIDPGDHTVEARAPGRRAWSVKVSVSADAPVVEVSVPILPELPDLPGVSRRRRTIAYAVGGGGVAVVAGALVFGVLAQSKWNESRSHCDAGLCDQTGVDLARSARDLGNLSTVSFAVGAAAVAVGIVVYMTAPSAHAEVPQRANPVVLRVVPTIGQQVGLTLQGGF